MLVAKAKFVPITLLLVLVGCSILAALPLKPEQMLEDEPNQMYGMSNMGDNQNEVRRLPEDYLNGILNLHGRMLFNTLDQPSELKLYGHSNVASQVHKRTYQDEN